MDINLPNLRRTLHQYPDLSGDEASTAKRIVECLLLLPADCLLQGVGGHGVIAIFEGREPGPTLVFRAELDALPIQEANEFDHRSITPGTSHKCGHDGHSTILVGLAQRLRSQPPTRGRVALLFQPSEENGQGGPQVAADPKLTQLAPDFIFALHNWPGLPFGQVLIRPGAMLCGSVGLFVELEGRSAHAANPEQGISPLPTLAEIVQTLPSIADTVPGASHISALHRAGPSSEQSCAVRIPSPWNRFGQRPKPMSNLWPSLLD